MAAPGGNEAEMEHRKQLMETWRDKKLERPKFDDRAIFGPRQGQVVLFNVSHAQRSPQPKDSQDPSIIFFGVFNSQEAAVAHARILNTQHSEIDYLISSLGKWNMMNVNRSTDQAVVEERIVARLEEDRKRRDRNFDQLKLAQEKRLSSRTSYQKSEREKRRTNQPTQHEAQRNTGVPVPITEAPATEAPIEPMPGTSDFHQHVPQLLMGLTLTGQRFLVISILKDTSKLVRLRKRLPEPLWRVYAVFSSRKKAENYIKHTLAAHIGDYDLDVVEMYSYLHPQNLDVNELTEEFRDPEINNIINYAKTERQATKDFRQKCALEGKEADMSYLVGKEPVTIEMQDTAATEPQAQNISELLSADSADDFASMKRDFLESGAPQYSETTPDSQAQPPGGISELLSADCVDDFALMKSGFLESIKATDYPQ